MVPLFQNSIDDLKAWYEDYLSNEVRARGAWDDVGRAQEAAGRRLG